MAENVLLWDDSRGMVRVLPGVTGQSGGDGSTIPFSLFWDPAQKPAAPSGEDDEFEGTDLDPRWVKVGDWVQGGVARGDSFDSPAQRVRYSVNTDRFSHLVMQIVAGEDLVGLYRELLPENRDGDNAPENWLIRWGSFQENDYSSVPMGNQDNLTLIMMADKDIDGSPNFANWVGFFITTDFTDLDLPVTVGMSHATDPEDLDAVGVHSFLKLPALPSYNQLKLHKIGTTYRGYVVIDGRNVQVGEIDLPTHNPTMYAIYSANIDMPNTLGFLDYVRHEFTDKEAA